MVDRPILSVEGLSVAFDTASGPRRVLDDVSLAVIEGSIFALVGESGSGKSTLIAAALGLLPATARVTTGRIVACDREVASSAARPAPAAGHGLALVGQNPMGALNPVMTIGRQLADLQHARADLSARDKHDRASEWLGRVGIPDPRRRLEAYPFELSGGMLQRVAIAAALMLEPRILFADEPTTALDVTVEAQILRLILDARDAYGLTVVLVTHHLAMVSGLASRVAVLYAGTLVEDGPTAAVLGSPRHPYTAALVACDPGHAPAGGRRAPLPMIAGRPPSPDAPLPGCRFAPRCASAGDACHRTRPAVTHDAGHRAACHFPLAGPPARIPLSEESAP
jgi:oligopeptide/dipeptide ABC transporter ATP-binding protein